MLLGALLPAQAATTWGLPPSLAPRFLAALHQALAISVAELLRHQEQLMVASKAAEGGQGLVQAEQHPTYRTSTITGWPPRSGAVTPVGGRRCCPLWGPCLLQCASDGRNPPLAATPAGGIDPNRYAGVLDTQRGAGSGVLGVI